METKHPARSGDGDQPLAQQAFIELVRSESSRMAELNALLRPEGLSEAQYNVLRILRGAGQDGLPCGQISARMLTRLPDITRLVDRLERQGRVTRFRPASDRRVVLIRITAAGRRLLARLEVSVRDLHDDQFAALTRMELRQLVRLLVKVQERSRQGNGFHGSDPS
jgi:DNA-binding MarR family transcriptional regulator